MPKDLGPQMFCSDDELIISWKGENYYKACGEFVVQYSGGMRSHCVKRVGHPSVYHEDYKGFVTK